MKQRDLLFAGLMLMAAPAFAQEDGPTFDESKDARVVFTQNFEAEWETWSTVPVDTIEQVEYYKNKQTSNSNSLKPWENPNDWKKGIFRDTTIYLRNGVVITDDKKETWAEKDATAGTIIADAGTEKRDRADALKGFGETDGGGDRYFKFLTDTSPKLPSGSGSFSDGHAARYRRNLFVRGVDIEDHSSYRLTFYVKAKARKGHEDVSPYMVADVMRGYFHAEKPFSMGYIDNSKEYKYNRAFEYTKDFFNGEWEKCTFMTYYIDDEVANNYVFVNGYWWAEDSAWYWAKGYKGNNTGMDLFYHVQPDKFFVRLGFSSNYTEFALDNLSLTKSFIGGVEYYQHMLRVDFGYQTNLKDLAREAYAKTKIDAVEIPGEYFDVWGLKKDGTWEYTEIASAEYQGDGYMYLFADGYEKDGEFIRYTFDQYDKVLVSFYNPKEADIQLKYTGSMFPKADDIEWIKAGKLVENFYNEEAHLNPYVFTDVYSMYDRPPVMQRAEYEDGSFGLDGKIKSITFKFSRQMDIDDPADAATRQKCVVYVGDEIWDRTWNAADSTLTITRPTKYQNNDLDGDYLIELNNLFIPNTQRKADDVRIHYNFGPINRDLSSLSIGKPIWDAKFYDKTVNKGETKLMPAGTAATYEVRQGWSYVRNLEIGDGVSVKNAAQLFFYQDSYKYPRALFLCPMGSSENHPAYLYLGYGDGFNINMSNGAYIVKFDAGSFYKDATIGVRLMPYKEDPRTIDAEDIMEIGSYSFNKSFAKGIHDDPTSDLDTLMTPMQFGFAVEKPGRYLVEISCKCPSSGSNPGVMLSNIELYSAPVCFNPIKALNEAVDAAQARATLAAGAKYEGEALTALTALINQYKIGGSFTSTKPSDWTNAAKATTDGTQAMKLRMDTVDLVVKQAEEVAKKLTSAAAENANWANLIDYVALNRIKGVYDAYVYSTKTNAELTAFIDEMKKAIETLDARIADTKKFNAAMKAAKALIDAKEQESFTEYGDLKDAYEDKEGFDTILTTDDQLTAALNEIVDLTDAYRLSVGIFKVGTRRIKELDKLAKDLGSTIADTTVVKDLFDNLKSDDDYLAAIYKSAIKAAIYEKGAAAGELDLTAFVKNYYLYATPSFIEMLDKNQTDNRNDFNYDADKHGKARVVHTNHKWNSVEIWMTMTNADFVDLMPGWTFKAVNDGNGNDMVYVDSLSKNSNLKEGVAVFDGAVSMDWGSNAVLTQTVLGLPAGEYNLGIDIRSDYSFENKGKGTSAGSLTALSASDTATASITTDYLDPATYTLQKIDSLPGQFDTIAIDNKHHCDSTVFVSVDVKVGDGEKMAITLDLRTNNGSAQADNFKLTFKPSATFDYAAAAAEAKAKVAEVITLVDFNKAQKANVEFYTLGGLKVDGAKAGQILIRKTTGANGKVSFDKVLLK